MNLRQRFREAPRRVWPALVVGSVWQALVYELTDHFRAADTYFYDFTLEPDLTVPFLPWTSIIYLASFGFWFAVYFYCGVRDRERADRFFSADFLAKTICLVLFLVLPTTNVRPEVTGDSVGAFVMRAVYWADKPRNLFPSLHCMMSWLCYLGVRETPEAPRRLKIGVLAAALTIFLSTLTTRQHVVVDVLGGVALAEICWRICADGPIPCVYGETIDRLTARIEKKSGKNAGKDVDQCEKESA